MYVLLHMEGIQILCIESKRPNDVILEGCLSMIPSFASR